LWFYTGRLAAGIFGALMLKVCCLWFLFAPSSSSVVLRIFCGNGGFFFEFCLDQWGKL
jgi:hypothetical protein